MQAKYPNRTEVGSSIPESTLKVNREMCGSSCHARSRSDSSMGGRGDRLELSTRGGSYAAPALIGACDNHVEHSINSNFNSKVGSGGRVVSSPLISRTIEAARNAAKDVWGQKDEEQGVIQRYVCAFIEICVYVVCTWLVAGIIIVLMHTAGAF